MRNNAPAHIVVNSFADSALDLQLVGDGTDKDFVDVALADVVNLSAIGNTVAGTFDATAIANASVGITNGRLSGTDATFLTVDATASADGATILLHVTDRLQFALSGTGYTGVGITLSAQTGGSLVVQPASSASADEGSSDDNKGSFQDDKGEFDLARFASSVLGELRVSFATGRGETLSGVGSSVLTIDATTDLPNGKQLILDKVRTTPIAFSSGWSDQDRVTPLHVGLNHLD